MPAGHAPSRSSPLLRVHGLCVDFPHARAQSARVVDHVSFELPAGGALGIVGESGSGKSTLARALVGLAPVAAGSATLDGVEFLRLRGSARQQIRRRIQMIFQDPGGSLNPRFTAEEAVAEPLLVHAIAPTRGDALRQARALLSRCGLPSDAAPRLPHEFSGGQRQRIAIARALACRPDILLCDEPTSALDVSSQAVVLNLLADLRRSGSLALLFISHDLAVVNHMCDHVAVMQRGRFVEMGPRAQVLESPAHEYTQLLVSVARGQ